MKKFLIYPLLCLALVCVDLAHSGAKEQIVDKVTSEKTEEKLSENKKVKIKVDALETKALNEMSDSTQTKLEEEKKGASKAVVATQKALLEKEAVQNKVKQTENKLKEANENLKKAQAEKSNFETQKLKKEAKKLEKEYNKLQKELELKNSKAKKVFEKSSLQQGKIAELEEQLRQMEIEKNKRQSPRKKAFSLLLIVVVMLMTLFFKDKILNIFENKIINKGSNAGSVRRLKIRTFLRISSWLISIVIIAVAFFFILELFGFDSTTTLAGAGIFSVAIGFGAQQFIKDIFSGLFIVLEGQYGVNDFIAVGKYSGNVEDINLRFTKLRSYEGNVIYVPNGSIKSVVNYGKSYANAVVKFYIDINQDVETVFSIIRETVSELQQVPNLKNEIFGHVELLGINAFTPTGVEIKFRLKTAPQSQWLVGRETRLALKKQFDIQGIKLFQYSYNHKPHQQ